MSVSQPYLPDREQLSTAELREMASTLNAILKSERSRISVQERARLNRITNAKQQKESGYLLLLPKFVQVVEQDGSRLFLGNEEISIEDLTERTLRDHFSVKYFFHSDLNSQLRDLCNLLEGFQHGGASGEFPLKDQHYLLGHNKSNARINTIPEIIVTQLCSIYRRVFGLHPYLGGVGANEIDRQPNSPFGVFASFTLKELGIRTRTGSFFAPNSMKNLMPKGSLASSMPEDEEELVIARHELELESESRAGNGKRGRGRPRKSVRLEACPAGGAKSTPARK